MSSIRIPTQKRSIEKRKIIVEKGFELMCKNGFYNTNTNEIAKYAGVSTGIIYQYFNDKKEIFLEGVKNYTNFIMFPMLDVFHTEKISIDNLNNLLILLINKFIEKHTISKRAHEELLAMQHLDEDVFNVFKESELMMTETIVEILKNNYINIVNAKEKIHVIIGIVDNFCHEIVYHRHEELSYDAMRDVVINAVNDILRN